MRKPVKAAIVVSILEDLLLLGLMNHGLTKKGAQHRFEKELDYYRNMRLEDRSLADIFEQCALSLANRNMAYSVVLGGTNLWSEKVRAKFRDVLFDFNPEKVLRKYAGKHKSLLKKLVQARGLQGDQANRQLSNPRSLFPQYTHGLLEAAEYFAPFGNGAAFTTMIRNQISQGPEAVAQLPFDFRFTGMSYALAADFLKEIGVKELVKPDVHVRRFAGVARWVPAVAPELDFQKAFCKASQELGDRYPPVIIEKLMFLAGSGRFEMGGTNYKCPSCFARFGRRIESL